MHVFPTPKRRRRSSSSTGGVGGVSAAFVAVCCSTLMLQVLTTTAPSQLTTPPAAATLSSSLETRASDLFGALLARVGRSMRVSLSSGKESDSNDGDDAVGMRMNDMRVSNVSVHRVRYVANDDGENESDQEANDKEVTGDSESGWNGSEAQAQQNDEATESFMGRWTRKVGFLGSSSKSDHKRAEVTSVVVTWDDHFHAAASPQESDDHDTNDTKKESKSGHIVTYELQHWVNGWGLDALWHPSNHKLTVSDPFVVLSNLPQEYEIAFRVRMKVKKTTGLLSGLFATETDGPWSATALLSPSRGDALEAIFVFLASNKAFFLVLLMCIGSGSLVVFKLLVSHRFNGSKSTLNSALATTSHLEDLHPRRSSSSATRRSSSGARAPATSAASGGELEQEIKDLRQELADSEAEVHKLMLYRGYGVERLGPQELTLMEQELRVTLQRIQKLQKQRSRTNSMEDLDMEEDESNSEASSVGKDHYHRHHQEEQRRKSISNGGGSAHARRRRLGAVFEDDDAGY